MWNSRKTFLIFALLLFSLSQLSAAWPFFGIKRAPDPLLIEKQELLEQEIAKNQKILEYATVLETQLSEIKKTSIDSETVIEKLKLDLKASNQELMKSNEIIATLSAELEMRKILSGLSEESYQEKKVAYDTILAEYEVKADESDDLFQIAANAVADKPKTLGGLIGANASYDSDTGDVDYGVMIGISVKDIAFTVGTEIDISNIISIPKKYTVGLQYRF
jgi:hypothetical protein